MANNEFTFNAKTGTMEAVPKQLAEAQKIKSSDTSDQGYTELFPPLKTVAEAAPPQSGSDDIGKYTILQFREGADLTMLQIVDKDTKSILGYISGYALDINFNMGELNSMQRIEAFLEGIKTAFRKVIYDKAFENKSK